MIVLCVNKVAKTVVRKSVELRSQSIKTITVTRQEVVSLLGKIRGDYYLWYGSMHWYDMVLYVCMLCYGMYAMLWYAIFWYAIVWDYTLMV